MYEITEIQDISRPRCKRFVAHINIQTKDKNTLKRIIREATQNIKYTKECSLRTKEKFGDTPAHVVRLYIHGTSGLIAQSMWVDNTLEDVPLPKPLNYNDYDGDIGIVWLK